MAYSDTLHRVGPDIIIQNKNTTIVIKLTCPFEVKLIKSNLYKQKLYDNLQSEFLTPTPHSILFLKMSSLGFIHHETNKSIKRFRLNVPYKEVNRLPAFSIVCITTVCFTDQNMCIIQTRPKAVPIIFFFNDTTLAQLVDPERGAYELIYRLVCKLEGRQVDLTFRKPLFFYQDVQLVEI